VQLHGASTADVQTRAMSRLKVAAPEERCRSSYQRRQLGGYEVLGSTSYLASTNEAEGDHPREPPSELAETDRAS